jgi:hypothetical protein
MRQRLVGGLAALLGATALVLGIQAPAHAGDVSDYEVIQYTNSGLCYAILEKDPLSGKDHYVSGLFSNQGSGFTCIGMLERSTDGGAHFTVVSGYHYLASGPTPTVGQTGDYWDGPGYLARACFYFDFSGSAVHCTKWFTD